MLLLLRYANVRLPSERVRLYLDLVTKLLGRWNRVRSTIAAAETELPVNDLLTVWADVANWLHQETPSGAITEAQLHRRLVAALENHELDDNDPHAVARSYLDAARNRAGLLEERANGIFAFRHPTFEEFFAAIHLTTPSGTAIERLLPLRADPRWREVVLLAVGYLTVYQNDAATASDLVRAIADNDIPATEVFGHPRLRLAAASILDAPGIRRRTKDHILTRLATAAFNYPTDDLLDAFVEFTVGADHETRHPETIVALVNASRSPHWQVRMAAAHALAPTATLGQKP